MAAQKDRGGREERGGASPGTRPVPAPQKPSPATSPPPKPVKK
jgi:hypothetical protein